MKSSLSGPNAPARSRVAAFAVSTIAAALPLLSTGAACAQDAGDPTGQLSPLRFTLFG